MKNTSSRRHQAGLSMVEAAMACVILGVAALVLWQYVALQQRQQVQQQSESSLQRAQTALAAYAQLHGRLPCPALDTQGIENCAVAASDGNFPFITAGATDSAMGKLRYHVSLDAPSLTNAPAFKALMPATAGLNMVAVPTALNTVVSPTSDHLLDFCAALGVKATAASAAGASEDVAFGVAEESHPVSAGSAAGTDAARVVSRAQLRSQLHCAPLVAAGGRAHFNAYLAAATTRRSLQDYWTQFDVGYGLYGWDLGQGVWFAANSLYGSLRSSVKLTSALSSMDANMFDNVPQSVKALAGAVIAGATVVQNATYTVALTSNVARFSHNLVNARANRDISKHLVLKAQALEDEIRRNALLNSASTFFLAEQAQQPIGPVQPASVRAGIYGGELWRGAASYARALGGGRYVGNVNNVPPVDGDTPVSACQNPDSDLCRATQSLENFQSACQNPDSDACKAAMQSRYPSACQNPESDACKALVQGIAIHQKAEDAEAVAGATAQGAATVKSACEGPNITSTACKAAIERQKNLRSTCQKPDSAACKAAIQAITSG